MVFEVVVVVWDAEMKFYFWDVKGRWVRMRFHKMVSFLLLSFRILVGMEGGLLYIELVMMMVIVGIQDVMMVKYDHSIYYSLRVPLYLRLHSA